MNNLDIFVALAFSLIVFITGVTFAKKGGDSKSFFAAGGSVPWWISGVSLYMSFFSVGTFVVWGAIAYSDGMVAVALQATMCIAGFIIGFFIAPKWREANVLTAAEFIGRRLGERLRKIYTILFLFISMFTAGFFLYPVGRIIEVATGIPLEVCIIALGLLILIYTAAGGLWAVLVTDVLQFVVLTAAVLIVVPLAFGEVGGVSQFIAKAPDRFFALQSEEYTWAFLLAFLAYNVFYIGGNWAYVQRYTSVATPKDARKVAWLFGALYIISPLIWMLPPMIYRVLQPEMQGLDTEGAYLQISKIVIPTGLLGLVLASMIFATASSVNTTLNISAGVFTNDIYSFFRKKLSDKETMIVARLSTIVFGLITIFIALMVQRLGGIVEVVLSIAALTGGAMFLPPMWALFSSRQTASSILTATIVSLLVNVFFKFFAPDLLDITLSRTEEMLVGVLVPITILTAAEIVYYVLDIRDSRFLNYKSQMYVPADVLARSATVGLATTDSETDSATADSDISLQQNENERGKKIIGYGVACVGSLIFVLGLGASKATLLVCTMGAIIVAIAIGGISVSRKNARKVIENAS